MLRNHRLWVVFAGIALLGSLAIIREVNLPAAIAQQPNPTPTPKPTEPPPALTCCDAMNPGGHTIAGPGVQRQMPGDAFDDTIIFLTLGRAQVACATVENLAPSGIELFIRSDDDHRLPVKAGKTLTFCARTTIFRVYCD